MEEAICFVENEISKMLKGESWGMKDMFYESSGSRDQDVDQHACM
jgi:hypothetical protein